MIFYSHRLKTVLQHTVRELGLTLSIDDSNAGVSIAENEQMIRETARIMGIKVEFIAGANGTSVVFYN
jgi:hypothetical protein